jgi:hypothetical protein
VDRMGVLTSNLHAIARAEAARDEDRNRGKRTQEMLHRHPFPFRTRN